jgi:hypothetical protein
VEWPRGAGAGGQSTLLVGAAGAVEPSEHPPESCGLGSLAHSWAGRFV